MENKGKKLWVKYSEIGADTEDISWQNKHWIHQRSNGAVKVTENIQIKKGAGRCGGWHWYVRKSRVSCDAGVIQDSLKITSN